MKTILMILLLLSSFQLIANEDYTDLVEIGTGKSFQLKSLNTACKPGYNSRLIVSFNDHAKVTFKENDLYIRHIFESASVRDVFVKSVCEPVECIYRFTDGFSNNYEVYFEGQNGNKVVAGINLSQTKARILANDLKNDGRCVSVRKIGVALR